MASLKATYSSETDIPEGLAGFYNKQADGSYKINLDGGVKTQADVDRVNDALEKERNLRIEADKNVAKYKDVDLEKWEKVKDIDPDRKPVEGDKTEEEIRKELSKEYRQKEQDLEDKFKKREEELEGKVTEATSKAQNTIKENWQRKMLSEKYGFTDPRRLNALMLEIKHGTDPEFSKIRKQFESIEVEEDGDKFKVVGGTVKDEQGAIEVLEEISKNEISKHYKPASDNSGGGAHNNGGNNEVKENPFKIGEHHNVTKQSQIINDNPEQARKLAKEAGWSEREIASIK